MGACLSNQTALVDRQIAQSVEKENKQSKSVIKVLLLGTGDSGKSTIIKQLRLIYGDAANKTLVDDVALQAARAPCFSNLVEGAKGMIKAMNADPSLPKIRNKNTLAEAAFLNGIVGDLTELVPAVAKAITTLWEDSDVRAAWEQRSKIQVLESWGTFAAKCKDYPEWGGVDWIPSKEEFLLIRVRTTGMNETTFVVERKRFIYTDVGGQVSERKKWRRAFFGINAVLFVTALCEYNEKMFEVADTNRLVDSVRMFRNVLRTQELKNNCLVLFLNKADLFKNKLCDRRIPLNESGEFPDAPDTFDYETGVQWICGLFKAEIEIFNEELMLIPQKTAWMESSLNRLYNFHFTTAIDQTKAKAVLDAVGISIVKAVLSNLRMI